MVTIYNVKKVSTANREELMRALEVARIPGRHLYSIQKVYDILSARENPWEEPGKNYPDTVGVWSSPESNFDTGLVKDGDEELLATFDWDPRDKYPTAFIILEQ